MAGLYGGGGAAPASNAWLTNAYNLSQQTANSQNQAAHQQYQQNLGAVNQNLTNRGLGNTTISANMQQAPLQTYNNYLSQIASNQAQQGEGIMMQGAGIANQQQMQQNSIAAQQQEQQQQAQNQAGMQAGAMTAQNAANAGSQLQNWANNFQNSGNGGGGGTLANGYGMMPAPSGGGAPAYNQIAASMAAQQGFAGQQGTPPAGTDLGSGYVADGQGGYTAGMPTGSSGLQW